MELLGVVRTQWAREHVFGPPVVQDGVTVIPVSRLSGGGGAGSGEEPEGNGHRPARGSGGGFGFGASPAGVYVLRDGTVRWQPAVDVNRLMAGFQVIAALVLLVVRARLRRLPGTRPARRAERATQS